MCKAIIKQLKNNIDHYQSLVEECITKANSTNEELNHILNTSQLRIIVGWDAKIKCKYIAT
jgi:hypothetical protein